MRTNRRMFLMGSAALGAAGLGSCASGSPGTPAPAVPAVPTPASPPGPVVASGFPAIADTATRLDAGKARALRLSGVKTVFRYYSFVPPTLPGKHLEPEEAGIILGEGLSLGAVFQHFNNCFRTFENKWGREDAEQALRQANAVKQPAGSAIYFGVDGDWPWAATRDAVVAYFEDVAKAFAGSGYDVGVYSNGCLCNSVVEKGLATYAWLSGSTGHSGTQAFYNSGRWTMFQNALDITPVAVGFPIDCNLLNPGAGGYFGQFDAAGARTAAFPGPVAAQEIAARRFLLTATDIKEQPDAASPTLVALRKDLNVRVVGGSGDWTRILTQEGAPNRAGAAREGWAPSASLIPMNRFADSGAGYGLCGSATQPTDAQKYANCERAAFRLR
jgi:hypothetical protein